MTDITFSHPHDHFRHQHSAATPNTCFVLMPFEDRFKIVYQSVVSALEGFMICKRADDLQIGHSILERILTGIRCAEFVIADITDRNPNVFYELGLAHVHTKNVLLLTRDIKDIPFDLRGLFCHQYSVDSLEGLKALEKVVVNAAREARSKTTPAMLKGVLDRTDQIIRSLDRVLDLPNGSPMPVVRLQAGLSSLSNAAYSHPQDETGRYGLLIEAERDRTIKILERGGTLRAIIHPPRGPWPINEGGRLRHRFDHLIEFIDREDLWPRWEIVISEQEGPNLLFVGEEILFDGHKTGIDGGYGWTFVYLDRELLATRLTIFDMFFQSARSQTLKTYGDTYGDDSRDSLRKAVKKAIVMARDGKRRTRSQTA